MEYIAVLRREDGVGVGLKLTNLQVGTVGSPVRRGEEGLGMELVAQIDRDSPSPLGIGMEYIALLFRRPREGQGWVVPDSPTPPGIGIGYGMNLECSV